MCTSRPRHACEKDRQSLKFNYQPMQSSIGLRTKEFRALCTDRDRPDAPASVIGRCAKSQNKFKASL